MPRYRISWEEVATIHAEIDADSPEIAAEIIREQDIDALVDRHWEEYDRSEPMNIRVTDADGNETEFDVNEL